MDGAIAAALNAGADIVGANCGTDLSLDDYVVLAEEIYAIPVPRLRYCNPMQERLELLQRERSTTPLPKTWRPLPCASAMREFR